MLKRIGLGAAILLTSMATAVAVSASPAAASTPHYCNNISWAYQAATDGLVLAPTYADPSNLAVKPKIDCEMNRLNEYGTVGEHQAIQQIQRSLRDCYGKNITVDGRYGNNTRQAVREVQHRINDQVQSYVGLRPLIEDGWSGPMTRTYMNMWGSTWGDQCTQIDFATGVTPYPTWWFICYKSPASTEIKYNCPLV